MSEVAIGEQVEQVRVRFVRGEKIAIDGVGHQIQAVKARQELDLATDVAERVIGSGLAIAVDEESGRPVIERAAEQRQRRTATAAKLAEIEAELRAERGVLVQYRERAGTIEADSLTGLGPVRAAEKAIEDEARQAAKVQVLERAIRVLSDELAKIESQERRLKSRLAGERVRAEREETIQVARAMAGLLGQAAALNDELERLGGVADALVWGQMRARDPYSKLSHWLREVERLEAK